MNINTSSCDEPNTHLCYIYLSLESCMMIFNMGNIDINFEMNIIGIIGIGLFQNFIFMEQCWKRSCNLYMAH